MASSWGASRPPLAVKITPLAGTNDFDCELSAKLQQLEGHKGGSDAPVLRRKLRPRNLNVEAMMEIPGEELEGLSSRALSWWDLPEDERMARVWPGEEESGDGLDSPFSIQSGQTTPGAVTPPLDGQGLRPWTLSFIPPEELRLPGYAYDGAQTSPVSSAGPSRENTPRGPNRNLFFGDAAHAGGPAGAARGDPASAVSFTAHLAGLRKANEARADALHSSMKRSNTLQSLQDLAAKEAEAAASFKDVQLTPPQQRDALRPQKSSSLGAASTSGRPGFYSGSTGMYAGKENVPQRGPPHQESSFNPSSLSSRPCTPPLRSFGEDSAPSSQPQPAAPPLAHPAAGAGGLDSAASSASDLQACGMRGGGGESQCSLSQHSSCSTLYGTPHYTRRKPGGGDYRSSPSSHSSSRHSSRTHGSGGRELADTSASAYAGRGFARACALFGLPACRTEDRKGAKAGGNPYQTPPATPDIAKFKSGGVRRNLASPLTPSKASPVRAFGSFSLSSPSTPGSLPEDREVGVLSPLSSILGSPAPWSVFSPGAIAKMDGKKKTRFSCGGIVVLC